MGRQAARAGRIFAFAWAVVLWIGIAPGAGQDFRGSILGTVVDTTGGVLPGVSVTVANVETGVKQTVVTDSSGGYRVLYLNPGTYAVTVELDGFKKVVMPANQVRVGSALRVDVKLEAGGVTETVEVVAQAPLLDTTTGITGTTIDSKQIASLPLGDGTAYMLTRLAPGIMDSSDLHFARPMDNGNLGGIISNGVQGGNEFSIDGAPNGSNAKGVGFSPPSDSISEFKVQTNAFDAQAGHTAGAVVNLALRSGTNAFHGWGGYFNRDGSRTATPLFTKLAGGTKPTRQYNRFTGTVSGPILKDKTFFMGSFEWLKDIQPEPAYYTVPTAKMRSGDLSEFTVAVYDPSTATSSGVRTAFPGNLIPANRINPVAAAYAKYFPEPNVAGKTESNYFTNQLRPYDYYGGLGRVDHNFNSSNKLFATFYYNKRREDRYNWAKGAANATGEGVINGFAVTQGYDYRSNTGVTGAYTAVLSPSMLLDIRVSGAKFGEWRDPAATFDPSTLGFSSTALGLMGDYKYMPLFTFGTFSTTNSNSTIAALGAQRSDWGEGFNRPMNTYSSIATFTKMWGAHTVRAGYDFRLQQWQITNNGYPSGRYQFNGAYTRANNSAAQNDRAQSWAQFLLGLPTSNTGAVATPGTSSSQFEIAALGDYQQLYHGLYVQDDWRVNKQLTLNLGARLEINPGLTEALNRNLAGFDTISANPIEAAAVAAYAKNPMPEIPVSDFKVKGGLLFANGATYDTLVKALPRFGGAYMINEKTVLRGGVGLFSYDMFFDNINQQGFSRATPILTTENNGVTFTGATLTNPIPNGQLLQPTGSSTGLATSLGTNLTSNSPGNGGPQTSNNLVQPNRQAPYYTRWQVGLQRQFGQGYVVEVTYVGSRGTNLPVFHDANNIPMKYLSTLPYRDTANESYLTQNVPNPFAGLVPGGTFNGSTVSRQQLLRPYPEFGTFGFEEYTASDKYNAGSIQFEKRFKGGSNMTVQYTYSQLRDSMKYLNPADGTLEANRVSPNDRPHRFSVGGNLRMPFGRGEKWGKDWHPVLDGFLGGWQLSGTYQYQSGFPIVFGSNIYFNPSCGSPTSLKAYIGKDGAGLPGSNTPAWDTSCFYFHDAAVQTNGKDDPVKQRNDQRIQMGNNVRTFPSTMPDFRNDALHLLDIGLSKNFRLPGSMQFQFRLEAINALNYTVLWAPDINPRNSTFGYVTTERNNPRDIQLGFRLTF